MKSEFFRALAISAAFSPLTALAVPVIITTPFMNLENRAINSLGFSSGQFLRIGSNSVVPNGSAGTTGLGTTTDLVSGQTVSRTINFDPSPLNPDFFVRYLTDTPSLYGPWTLTYSNGADRSQAVVTLPAGTTQAPLSTRSRCPDQIRIQHFRGRHRPTRLSTDIGSTSMTSPWSTTTQTLGRSIPDK